MKYIDASKTTPNELRRLFPNSSRSTLEANSCLPHPESQPDQAPALDAAIPGKEKGMERIGICFRGYRVRPLDPDNFAGSVKDILDALKHAHLLRDDNFWEVRLQTEQVKVKSFEEEKTTIEITYP